MAAALLTKVLAWTLKGRFASPESSTAGAAIPPRAVAAEAPPDPPAAGAAAAALVAAAEGAAAADGDAVGEAAFTLPADDLAFAP